jgi:hypothetical protein
MRRGVFARTPDKNNPRQQNQLAILDYRRPYKTKKSLPDVVTVAAYWCAVPSETHYWSRVLYQEKNRKIRLSSRYLVPTPDAT